MQQIFDNTITPSEENQHVEFKSEKLNSAELFQEIVAFSIREGGEIWLSMEDDGSPSGLSRSHEEDVMNVCRNARIPPSYPAVKWNKAFCCQE